MDIFSASALGGSQAVGVVLDKAGMQAKAGLTIAIGADGVPVSGASGKAAVTGALTQANPNGSAFTPATGRAIGVTLTNVAPGEKVGLQRSYDGGQNWVTQTAGGVGGAAAAFPAFTGAADEAVDATDEGGVQVRVSILSGASAATNIGYAVRHR